TKGIANVSGKGPFGAFELCDGYLSINPVTSNIRANWKGQRSGTPECRIAMTSIGASNLRVKVEGHLPADIVPFIVLETSCSSMQMEGVLAWDYDSCYLMTPDGKEYPFAVRLRSNCLYDIDYGCEDNTVFVYG